MNPGCSGPAPRGRKALRHSNRSAVQPGIGKVARARPAGPRPAQSRDDRRGCRAGCHRTIINLQSWRLSPRLEAAALAPSFRAPPKQLWSDAHEQAIHPSRCRRGADPSSRGPCGRREHHGCRRVLPQPDLPEVGRGGPRPCGHPAQLPVGRLGRWHQSDPQSHGRFRRHRRAADCPTAHRRQSAAVPDGDGLGGSHREPAGHRGRPAQADRRRAGRDLPRQDHALERRQDRRVERRGDPAPAGHRASVSRGRVGHDLRLHLLPLGGVGRLARRSGCGDVGALAGRQRRARQ